MTDTPCVLWRREVNKTTGKVLDLWNSGREFEELSPGHQEWFLLLLRRIGHDTELLREAVAGTKPAHPSDDSSAPD